MGRQKGRRFLAHNTQKQDRCFLEVNSWVLVNFFCKFRLTNDAFNLGHMASGSGSKPDTFFSTILNFTPPCARVCVHILAHVHSGFAFLWPRSLFLLSASQCPSLVRTQVPLPPNFLVPSFLYRCRMATLLSAQCSVESRALIRGSCYFGYHFGYSRFPLAASQMPLNKKIEAC